MSLVHVRYRVTLLHPSLRGEQPYVSPAGPDGNTPADGTGRGAGSEAQRLVSRSVSPSGYMGSVNAAQ
jgi:hypothetical protein